MDEDGACDAEKEETETKTEKDTEPEIFVEEPIEITDMKKDAPAKPEEIEVVTESITGAVTDNLEFGEEELEAPKEFDSSKILDQLMKTYTEEVEGYKYQYNSDWYLVYDKKIKIKLENGKTFRSTKIGNKSYSSFFVDAVYLDVIDKTAIGYCEGYDQNMGNKQCLSLDIIDVPYPLPYGHYQTKRPDEWLFEVYTLDPEIITETGNYYVESRKVRRIEYQDGIKQVMMFFDEKLGLPVKIQTFINGQMSEMWVYYQLTANTVKEKHVRHRTAEEVSNKEAFYSTSN
jgi:hypothetical protein